MLESCQQGEELSTNHETKAKFCPQDFKDNMNTICIFLVHRSGEMSEAAPGLECDAILIGEIRIGP